METTFKFLQEIKWLIQPIYDIIVYFVTSNSGFYCLILIFAFYVIFSLINVIRNRMFFANASRNHRKNVSPLELIYLISSELGRIFFRIIIKTPLVLGILLLFLFVGGISKEITKINTFITESNEKKEIKSIFKHLDKKIKVAEVKVLKKDYESKMTNFRFQFCDMNGEILPKDTQIVSLKGDQFYFLSKNFNFSYSSMLDFQNKGLCVIQKMYSNEIPEKQGVILNFIPKENLPYFYQLEQENLLGISKENYTKGLQSLLNLIKKPVEAQSLGIKIKTSTISDKFFKKQEFSLWIDQKGNLSIEKKYNRNFSNNRNSSN